jgi:hypothetical protein
VRLALQARPCAIARQNMTCVCRRFASDIFLSFLPFVIRAKRRFANASTGICLLQFRTEHRMKSVVTIYVSDVP